MGSGPRKLPRHRALAPRWLTLASTWAQRVAASDAPRCAHPALPFLCLEHARLRVCRARSWVAKPSPSTMRPGLCGGSCALL